MQHEFSTALLMLPLTAFLFYFSQTKKNYLFVLANIYLILMVGVSVFGIGKYIYANYHQPPEWDFLTFWLDGKVALTGGNFYDVKNYQEMSLPYAPGDDFRKEILDVGFRYPPFTMFLFLPFSLFEVSKAYMLWQISNLLVCFACIYGLWRIFLKDQGLLGLLLIAVLMLMLAPTRSTFNYAQTNFLTLLFFLLFWWNRSKAWSGIWLALSVVVKPYMVFLYIYPLLTKKWKVLTSAVLILLALTFLSVLIFGPEVLISFLHNPTPNMPGYVYTEGVNQSLLATILRLSPGQIMKESLLLNPLYLGISLILTLITVWLAIKRNNNDDWVVLSILFLALIVYPASLEHYGVFLILPVVLLLRQSSRSVQERIITTLIIFTAYLLARSYGFFANVLIWFISLILGAKLTLRPREAETT